MICLACGQRLHGQESQECSECGEVYSPVPGIFGVNHPSQLLDALGKFRLGQLSLPLLKERFFALEEVWESFMARWDLNEQTVSQALDIRRELRSVYGKELDKLEDAVEHFNQALDLVETLEGVDSTQLDRLEEELYLFTRGACSACAELFHKLDTRHGDLQSLLSALGP